MLYRWFYRRRVIRSVFVVVCAWGFMLGNAQAQTPPSQKPVNPGPQTVNALMQQSDTLIQYRTRPATNGRIDVETGAFRALYRQQEAPVPGPFTSPARQALAYVHTYEALLGVESPLTTLREHSTVSTPYSHHVTYRQYFEGIPVYNSYVKVNLNREGEVTLVLNGYASHVNTTPLSSMQPVLTEQMAMERARSELAATIVDTSTPERVIVPSKPARLAWRMVAWTSNPSRELDILIDARDGALLAIYPLSTHAHRASGHTESDAASPGVGPAQPGNRSVTSERHLAETFVEPLARAVGTGYVFDPDPLTTSSRFYGPPFVDGNDAGVSEVDAERILVQLPDITQGGDGLYRLIGPHVQIVGTTARGGVNYEPPAVSSPDDFRFSRSEPFFEAVNAYYHIDKSQRYVQSLGLGRDIQNVSLRVNPHGMGDEDNSQYSSFQNFIEFGLGGVDDAEDAFVIWHEYGHALLEGSAPGLLGTFEGRALHEGWADYWAASYSREIQELNASHRSDWQSFFKWDSGDGTIWAGRQLGFAGTYPDDVYCDEGGFFCDIYADGMLWATTLMQVYDVLGRTITDRLNLASHIYLAPPLTFRDAAEAVIQADVDLYGGAHIGFLAQLFAERGLVTNTLGPVIVHEPLKATEQLEGTVPLRVEATGLFSEIERVFVVYTHPGADADTLDLAINADSVFVANLPLPSTPGSVSYYIGAFDELDLFTTDPLGAPGQLYSFDVGPDTSPPTIQHTPLTTLAISDWPASVSADVQDNLSVDSVQVMYYVEDPAGNRVDEDQFGLKFTSAGYRGTFPTSLDLIQPGSTVFYQIRAIDEAQAQNVAVDPESDYHSFDVVLKDGLFVEYDIERDEPGVVKSGSWARGEPAYGLRVAHSGRNVYATHPAAPYQEISQRSSLTLPPVNLQGIEQAYLVFWHWFEIEHAGDATPDGDSSAVLWDGGNVKVSTDDGATWDVLSPLTGYNGRIAEGRGNPMEGELAFGGFSYGWRQVVMPLPGKEEVRLRFDFGTDLDNAGGRRPAGWHLDDLSVVAELTEDPSYPRAVQLPEAVRVRDVGAAPPPVFANIFDNVGLSEVQVEYTYHDIDAGEQEGIFRLVMDSTLISGFYGAFPGDYSQAQVGDSITYRFVARDFAGNTSVFPNRLQPPLRVEYRLRDRINLLTRVQATGLWRRENDLWLVESSDVIAGVSSLVVGPVDLPRDVDQIALSMAFEQLIAENHGGNVKFSTDSARQWRVLLPESGYDETLPDDVGIPESMRGEEVFSGPWIGIREVKFDLADYAGQQLWFRIDFATDETPAQNEKWQINEASIHYSSLVAVDGEFDIPRTFALHGNFPDPFSFSTTISYTLSQASDVRLELFDVLGRKIQTLLQSRQSAGSYSLLYDGSRLSPGLYLLRLETNQGHDVERILVTR